MPPSDRDPPSASASTGKQPEKPRIVVSDAGPLISLGRMDLLPLLGALFAEVQVPDAVVVCVYCTERSPSYPTMHRTP